MLFLCFVSDFLFFFFGFLDSSVVVYNVLFFYL